MLIMDMPNFSPQQEPLIILAKVTLPSIKELYGTIGACFVTEKSNETNQKNNNVSGYGIGVRDIAWKVFTLKDPEYVDYGGRTLSDLVHKNSIEKGTPDYFAINADSATVKVLESPKHGALSKDLTKEISYYPNLGYVGTDKVMFLVDMVGYNIKVVYYFNVADVNLEKGDIQKIWYKYCPKDNWLISNSGNLTASLDATITLNTNAADQGRFIDYTPYLNEEFSPASNLNEWVTKSARSGVDY